MVHDSTNPDYNEEFIFSEMRRDDFCGKVIKLSVSDHEGGTKKVIGFSVLALDSCGLLQGEGDLHVKELMLQVQEKVSEELSELLSDRLELSLRYDADHGRLSLGIMLLRIFSLHTLNNDLGDEKSIFSLLNNLSSRYLYQGYSLRRLDCYQSKEDPTPELL